MFKFSSVKGMGKDILGVPAGAKALRKMRDHGA